MTTPELEEQFLLLSKYLYNMEKYLNGNSELLPNLDTEKICKEIIDKVLEYENYNDTNLQLIWNYSSIADTIGYSLFEDSPTTSRHPDFADQPKVYNYRMDLKQEDIDKISYQVRTIDSIFWDFIQEHSFKNSDKQKKSNPSLLQTIASLLESTKKSLPKTKNENTNSLEWRQLFREQAHAQKILSLLLEQKFINNFDEWIHSPEQITMIALYKALRQKGYIINDKNVSAPVLAEIFYKQFKLRFKSSKKWQNGGSIDADKYIERFSFIPSLKSNK